MENFAISLDSLYWTLGFGGPLILFVAFWVVYRHSTRARPEDAGLAEGPRVYAATDGPADGPADLGARQPYNLAAAPSTAPDSPAEILRSPPRPLEAVLAGTRSNLFGRLRSIFSRSEALSPAEIEEVEELLYTSDLGPQTVERLLSAVHRRVSVGSAEAGFEAVRSALKSEMLGIFEALGDDGVPNGAGGSGIQRGPDAYLEGLERLNIWTAKPAILMVVGVNGAGKTTTIGKLARRIAQSGRRVLVAAGDTFRAAAGDQLKVWTERAQVEIYHPVGITDPSAVAFDACQLGGSKGFDVVIIDTAGRLHTQKNLMEELKKMRRVVAKAVPGGPHEILLVLDANSGQNALQQAREFHQALSVSGVVLTKLDGSAKGGVAVGLACELGLPIKLVGVGEGVEDLRGFSAREFVDSII